MEAGDEIELLFLGQIGGGLHHFHAGGINAVRLLDENVFAGLQRRQGVQRMELGGIGNDHRVAGGDDLLVGVEAGETVVVGHGDLVGRVFLEFDALRLDTVWEDVAHRHQVGAFVGGQDLGGGAGVAAAATDHAELDDVAAGGVGHAGEVQRRERRGGGGNGGGFQEFAAGEGSRPWFVLWQGGVVHGDFRWLR